MKSFFLYVKVKESCIGNKEVQSHEGPLRKSKIEISLF